MVRFGIRLQAAWSLVTLRSLLICASCADWSRLFLVRLMFPDCMSCSGKRSKRASGRDLRACIGLNTRLRRPVIMMNSGRLSLSLIMRLAFRRREVGLNTLTNLGDGFRGLFIFNFPESIDCLTDSCFFSLGLLLCLPGLTAIYSNARSVLCGTLGFR